MNYGYHIITWLNLKDRNYEWSQTQKTAGRVLTENGLEEDLFGARNALYLDLRQGSANYSLGAKLGHHLFFCTLRS